MAAAAAAPAVSVSVAAGPPFVVAAAAVPPRRLSGLDAFFRAERPWLSVLVKRADAEKAFAVVEICSDAAHTYIRHGTLQGYMYKQSRRCTACGVFEGRSSVRHRILNTTFRCAFLHPQCCITHNTAPLHNHEWFSGMQHSPRGQQRPLVIWISGIMP